MQITTRQIFSAALTDNNRAQTALFRSLHNDLVALIAQYADDSGKIPPAKSQALRDSASAMIRGYFFNERPASSAEKKDEAVRLHDLIQTAQKQLRGANDRQAVEISRRVAMLANRLSLLEQRGIIIECIDAQGRGLTPYARALMEHIGDVVGGVISAHQSVIRRLVDGRK